MVAALQDTSELVEQVAIEYGAQLRRFFERRVKCASVAADLLQELYLRLLRFGPRDELRCRRSYVFAVALSVLSPHREMSASLPSALDTAGVVDELACDLGLDPAVQVERLDLMRAVARVVDGLPSKSKAVMLLRQDHEELTLEEIGRRVGVSRPMAKKYWLSGLERCRAAIGQTDLTRLRVAD